MTRLRTYCDIFVLELITALLMNVYAVEPTPAPVLPAQLSHAIVVHYTWLVSAVVGDKQPLMATLTAHDKHIPGLDTIGSGLVVLSRYPGHVYEPSPAVPVVH